MNRNSVVMTSPSQTTLLQQHHSRHFSKNTCATWRGNRQHQQIRREMEHRVRMSNKSSRTQIRFSQLEYARYGIPRAKVTQNRFCNQKFGSQKYRVSKSNTIEYNANSVLQSSISEKNTIPCININHNRF